MRLSTEIRDREAMRRRALASVQRAIAKSGAQAVADRLVTSIDTVKRWRDGDTIPTQFVAKRILEVYPA